MRQHLTGPLSEDGAEAYIAATCFKTGPPGQVGVELEWLVLDLNDPTRPVEPERTGTALEGLGPLPGNCYITTEPGGQLELSSRPAASLAACVTALETDTAVVAERLRAAGLALRGIGLDPSRRLRRVVDLPRYAAMEEFFDRSGGDGRVMMCGTASVQVSLDAGIDGPGPAGYRHRWRLLHALGPVLVAAFANSPVHRGRPTGWRSTRQAVWSRLDRSRTAVPGCGTRDPDPRTVWARYALDAQVLCVPGEDRLWTAPPGLTLRRWVRGGGPRPATAEDVDYHLSTLFPPVRPRGWLELRMIDAQPGADWLVPVAVVTALVEDHGAGERALAATERIARSGAGNVWLRAARLGLADPVIAAAARTCFRLARDALPRVGAPAHVVRAVDSYTERYVLRGRSPSDDRLEAWYRAQHAREEVVPCRPTQHA
ncbi:MAG: ergothioneine biosynthesis glutamate--cysteine ligase EgtA [Streptomycetales bacterium]